MWDVHIYLNNQDINVTSMCSSIEISGKDGDVCRQLSVTLQIGVYNRNFPNMHIPDYTPIWVKDLNEDGSFKDGLFSGIVVDFDKNHDCYSITAFDYAYYLKRNKITKKFLNTTAEDATKWICDKFGLSVKYLYPSKILIKSKPYNQQNAYDVIMDLYTQVKKATGYNFYISASYNNEVGVHRVGMITADQMITDKSNLLSIDYKETGSNMVNCVEVYDENNQLIETIKDEENMPSNIYGVLQENYKQEENVDYKTAVKNSVLHGIDKEISVEVLGNYNYYTGVGVKICIDYINDLKKKDDGSYVTAYIKGDTHTMDCSTGAYTTKLDLVLYEFMDEKDIKDEEEGADESNADGSDEYSSTKATGAKVVKYAKTFLGLPYVWGGNSLTTGTDCSGFMQLVYAHFGVSLPRTTYEQVNSGKAISTSDKSKWKKGDLIFNPSCGHVVMYVGDGQVIHEPQTGEVCKISNLWFTPSAVRRVL